MAGSKALLLLICFVLGCGCLCVSSPVAAAPRADFFYFTLMWPGSMCNQPLSSCCCPTTATAEKPKLDFFVQSLEPVDSSTGKPVTDCQTACSFKINALNGLISDLYAYWSDVRCPSNNGVEQWKRVWCTYGTCSNLTEKDYFQRALALRAEVDLLYILKDNDIVPSPTKIYKLSDIQNALIANFGFSTLVECNKRWPFFGKSQIFKIHICVSADAKSIISCPIRKTSNCDANVRFTPFTYGTISCPNSNCDTAADPIKMPSAHDAEM